MGNSAPCTATALLLATFCAHAQHIPPGVEARLAELEARAARADRLAARVTELEERLAAREDGGRELETLIAARLLDLPGSDSVSAARSKSMIFGGQLRLRAEYRNVGTYSAEDPRRTGDDGVVQRTRFNVLARPMDGVRVFVEFQDSRVWGEEGHPLADLEGVDLHQGYAAFEDLFGSGLDFQAGRYEMSLWNQRLVSPMDWHPVTRSFDGFLLTTDPAGEFYFQLGYNTIHEDPGPSPGRDTRLIHTVANYTGIEDHLLGAAVLWRRAGAPGPRVSDWTVALHGEGKTGGFDYSADLVAQFGDRSGSSVRAYGTAATLGYTFDCDWKPRIGVEWTWASGDDDPASGRSKTFDPLFPFGHAYQGYLDIFSWRNSHDLALHLTVRPAADWKIDLSVHSFWLDDRNDAWYGANLMPIRLDPGADSRHVGVEIDLAVRHDINSHIWIWFGYSHFFPGEYVDDTGRSPSLDWVWFQLTLGF